MFPTVEDDIFHIKIFYTFVPLFGEKSALHLKNKESGLINMAFMDLSIIDFSTFHTVRKKNHTKLSIYGQEVLLR